MKFLKLAVITTNLGLLFLQFILANFRSGDGVSLHEAELQLEQLTSTNQELFTQISRLSSLSVIQQSAESLNLGPIPVSALHLPPLAHSQNAVSNP